MPARGRELHSAVYISVLAAYAWMLMAAWISFGEPGRPDLVLSVATVIFIVFFAPPVICFRMAWKRVGARPPTWIEFVSSSVETATGRMSAAEAWLQILLVPCALAVAATLIGLAHSVIV